MVPPKIFYFRGFLVHIWEKVHKLDNIWHWTQNGIYYGVLIFFFFSHFSYIKWSLKPEKNKIVKISLNGFWKGTEHNKKWVGYIKNILARLFFSVYV